MQISLVRDFDDRIHGAAHSDVLREIAICLHQHLNKILSVGSVSASTGSLRE